MPQQATDERFTKFEITMRNLRWGLIGVVALSFPLSSPQSTSVYLLLALFAAYNLVTYISSLRSSKLIHSPLAMLAVDNLFAGLLLTLVGDVSTPYSAILVFMILMAAYLYQMKGVFIVGAVQLSILFFVATHPLTQTLVLDDFRLIGLTICALIAFGYFVVRVTDDDRQEHDILVDSKQHSEQESQRLLTLVNSLNVAIFLTDEKGVIQHSNDAAQLLGGGGELHGKNFGQVMPLRPRTKQQDDTTELFKNATTPQHRRDLTLVVAEDKTIDLDITVTPIRQGGETKPSEFIVVCEDITTERSLDEQRSGFISVASHELRTPLAILEAALETVMTPKNKLAPEVLTLLEQAHRNAKYLAAIIKDITLLSEAQNDNLPIRLSSIDAEDLVSSMVADFSVQAAQKGITITSNIDPKTPTILSTEQYIREILQNYMTNAIKYSMEGAVTLAVAPTSNGHVLFSVTDQGIGISPKNQKMLFTKFFRAEDFRTETTRGTGLGLYLCLEIAERMNAKVWCESKMNKGSTFFLEVPPFSNLKRDEGDVVEAQVANLVDGL